MKKASTEETTKSEYQRQYNESKARPTDTSKFRFFWFTSL